MEINASKAFMDLIDRLNGIPCTSFATETKDYLASLFKDDFGIDILDVNGNYKPLISVLDDCKIIYDSLAEEQRKELVNLICGKDSFYMKREVKSHLNK